MMGRSIFGAPVILITGLSVSAFVLYLADSQAYMPIAALFGLLLWSIVVVYWLSREVNRFLQITLFFLAIGLSFLAYLSSLLGFLGNFLTYFGLIILLLTVGGLLLIRMLKRGPAAKWLFGGVWVILWGTSASIVGGLLATPAPLFVDAATPSDRLKHLYQTDQADRFSGYWLLNPERDQHRLEYALALVETDGISDPQEQYYAAYLLQHGSCADHFRLAHQLAASAAAADIEGAQWLAEATFDRWQLAIGQPQTYGMQALPIPMRRPCEAVRDSQ